MKKTGIYAGILLTAGFICTLIGYASLELSDDISQRNNGGYSLVKEETAPQAPTSGPKTEEKEDTLETGTGKEIQVQETTRLVIRDYYTESGKEEEVRMDLPEAFVGKNRDELERYLPEYAALQSERERETLTYQLETFSESCVCLSRVRKNSEYSFTYYITLKDEEVVVFLEDEETVYEYTGIFESNLEEADVETLRQGIRADSLSELYGILENFSS